MAYEATAELYRRQYDLAKKRAQSEYDSRIGQLAEQYRQANRDLEGNLESRGILRSGEGMRGRVRLGAAEKSAQLAALTAQEEAMNQAGLTHAQQLAELQAKGYTGGGSSTPDSGTPGTPSPGGPGSPGSPGAPVTETPKDAGTPTTQTCPPGYQWDPVQNACVPISTGGPVAPGMPRLPPGQGGINEIGSGGRPIGSPPSLDFSGVDWAGLGKIINKPVTPKPLTPIKGKY